MRGSIKNCEDLHFSEFCSERRMFIVPTFQRAYKWTTKNISDLWESITSYPSKYFIGNIVCLEGASNIDGRMLIIDGQQRLITVSLILTAIRDEYKEIAKTVKGEDKESIEESLDTIKNILTHKELKRTAKREPRILPGRKNACDVYIKILDSKINVNNKAELKNLDGSQIKYVKNYKTIKKLLAEYIKDNKLDKLEDILGRVLDLVIITIICETDSDAYNIFEGLNATGIGLSVADLVKNAVMYSAGSTDARKSVEQNWELMESVFEKTTVSLIPKFLRHQWISHEGYIQGSKLFDSIKSKKLKGKSNAKIVNYVKSILNDAKLYSDLRSDNDDELKRYFNQKSIEILKWFQVLNIDQVYELILAFCNKFISSKGIYTEGQLCADLDRLWSFSFRAKLLSLNPSDYEKVFAEQCKLTERYNKKEMNRMTAKFYSTLKKKVSNDNDFIDKFASEIWYKDGSKNSLIYHIFNTMFKKKNPGIQLVSPTIEHILPKKPQKWGYEQSEIKEFVDNIGNLSLLYDSDNKKTGNEKMDDKVKKVYSVSPFAINNEIARYKKDFEEDPEKAIEKRAKALAREAAELWKL